MLLPSRCATGSRSKASPTGPKLSRQVRSEPACVPVTGCTKPGVVSVQAVRLNPEICIVVVDKNNLLTRGERKPTYWMYRKAAVLSRVMASGRGHHRGLRTGHAPIGVARELGRAHDFPATYCRSEGYRLTKGSWRPPVRFPTVSEPERGDTKQGTTAGCRKRATSEATGMNRGQS